MIDLESICVLLLSEIDNELSYLPIKHFFKSDLKLKFAVWLFYEKQKKAGHMKPVAVALRE